MYKNQLLCKKTRRIKTDLNTYQGKLKLHSFLKIKKCLIPKMSFTWRKTTNVHKNSPKIIKKWIEKCLNLTFYCIFSVVLLWFLQFYFLHLHTFVYEQIEDAFWHCHGDCTPVYDTRVCPCALGSRWILHTWKNIWCIWSSRTRVKFIIWTSCGATTRRIVTLAKLPTYWPASPTCTGSDTAAQCQRHNMQHIYMENWPPPTLTPSASVYVIFNLLKNNLEKVPWCLHSDHVARRSHWSSVWSTSLEPSCLRRVHPLSQLRHLTESSSMSWRRRWR